MTQTFEISHRRALFQSLAFFIHEKRVKLTMKPTKNTKKFAAVKIRRRCAIFPGDATIFTMAACRHAGNNGLRAKTDPGVRFCSRAPANGPATAEGARYQG